MSVSFSKRALSCVLGGLVFWAPVHAVRAQDAYGDIADAVGEQVAAEKPTARVAKRASPPEKSIEDAVAEHVQATGSDQHKRERLLGGRERVEPPAEVQEKPAAVEPKPEVSATPLALPSGPAKSAVTPQAISLPKGEGSIEGMGESFTPMLSTGTGTYSIPIALPKGRNGVGPSLSLSYSTSGGNGIVGLGWSLGVPFIARQTDKGLPRYVDSDSWHPEEDRFIYNGGQELVPVDNATVMAVDGAPVPLEFLGWQQYRARVEGGFMRFFRAPDSTRWVVQTKDGTRFDFGSIPTLSDSSLALQADPETGERVFAWFLTRTSDAHGSTVHYLYDQDAGSVYLADIYYDSPAACASLGTSLARRECALPFSDYGRHVHLVYETRDDVTSSYATTWRTESALRLSRVEVTSSMGTPGQRFLVRRYHLTYATDSFHSLLTSVQLEGRPSSYDQALGVYRGITDVAESALTSRIVGDLLPPMRFSYTRVAGSTTEVPGFGGIDAKVLTSTSTPDHSVDEARSDLFDINSDGLPDLLVTDPTQNQGAATVYFNGFAGGTPGRAGSFSDGVRVGVPDGLTGVMTLSNLNVVPMDIDGDGRSDLLHMPRQSNYGYFVVSKKPAGKIYKPLTDWEFVYVPTALDSGQTDPRIDLGKDTDVIKVVDVNKDHLSDVVKTTGSRIQTWLNLGYTPGGDGRFGSAKFDGTGYTLSTDPIETCLPTSGRQLDFSDTTVRFGDMNGDGLQDIVRLGFGDIVYWPGRGQGAWGDGTADCDDANRNSRHLSMTNPPLDLNSDLAGVHLMDVNADGADDLVQVGFDRMSVWFNQLGHGFTDRIQVSHTPFNTDLPAAVRIADIDGSGTLDIVFAHGASWKWIDPMGGQRPRLLQAVENGLGAATTLTYASSSEDYLRDLADASSCDPGTLDCFTWQREPLVGDASAGSCDAKVAARANGACVHRAGGSPVVSTVVRSISSTDNMDALGVPAQVSQSRYAYHDGYYEGIEQEFRGFGAADVTVVGDAFEPTGTSRTFFHQGRRPNDIAADRLADNPNEALKGREFLTESFDQSGRFLSTNHATYAVRKLATGLDTRTVSYAYVKSSDTFHYDTFAFAAGNSVVLLDSVLREQAGNGLSAVDAAAAREGDAPHSVVARGSSYQRVRTTIDVVDNVGQVLQQTAHGRGEGYGEQIVQFAEPMRVEDRDCAGSSWLWRTRSSYLRGGDDEGRRLQETYHEYDACGDPVLSGVRADLPPQGAFAFGGGDGGALSLVQASQDLRASVRNDVWGQVRETCAGGDLRTDDVATCLRYSKLDYDTGYNAVVVRESTATGSTNGQLALLSYQASWDFGLGTPTSSVDPNGFESRVFQDGLGRVTGTLLPNVRGCEGTQIPSTRIFYQLTDDPTLKPLNRVHTIQELSCVAVGKDMLESYAYVDGLGRPRAVLSEGDAQGETWEDRGGHAWIRGGLVDLNAKGKAAKAYQPGFYDSSPDSYGELLRNPRAEHVEQFYDAFGRATIGIAEDGSSTEVRYHAMSQEMWDEGDLDPSGSHWGTPSTVCFDGHGRTIAQQRINRHAGQLGTSGDEYHYLFSYYRADGALMSLTRALAPKGTSRPPRGFFNGLTRSAERRWFYDTAGRKTGALDPDTVSTLPGRPLTQAIWRYGYNAVGDLIAVRDPRNAGSNFLYDRAGRLVAEQYVRAGEVAVSGEAKLALAAGAIFADASTSTQDVDVLYSFDSYPSWASNLLTGATGVLGRATAVSDRAQRSTAVYDMRGNVTSTAKQLALLPHAMSFEGNPTAQSGRYPSFQETGPEVARGQKYDTQHTYVTTSTYDHADRGQTITLPGDPDFASGTAPVVGGALRYNAAGSLRASILTIDGQPYPIVSSTRYTRDGLIAQTTYGDNRNGRFATVSQTEYDARRRPVLFQTFRQAAIAPAGTRPLSAVSVVTDQRLTWDPAGNLIEIADRRPPSEWPAGHRPQSVQIAHDALYHVEVASFEYTQDNNSKSPVDVGTNWRDTETTHRTADPMHSTAAPMLPTVPSNRVSNLEYQYDWLANMVEWSEQDPAFYERSIGAIVNGNTFAQTVGATYRPSALYLASDLRNANPADKGGWLEVDYGISNSAGTESSSGNITAMTVHAQCTNESATQVCTDPGGTLSARRDALFANCDCHAEQHYSYRYDELNRLSEARRFDRVGADWVLKVRQRYRYDSSNQRALKETIEPNSGNARLALYVSEGFERRGLQASETAYQAIAAETESQYMVSGARVVWQNKSALIPGIDPDHRVTVALGDLIGSTGAVVDLMSGQLLESTGFYPNGAREHWLDSSETGASGVPLETMGFTGKEADEEVGLTYFGERYLVQRIGRWSTPDPAQIHAGEGGEALNSFHYVGGNLLQGHDPVGLQDATSQASSTNEASAEAEAQADLASRGQPINPPEGFKINGVEPADGTIFSPGGHTTYASSRAFTAATEGRSVYRIDRKAAFTPEVIKNTAYAQIEIGLGGNWVSELLGMPKGSGQTSNETTAIGALNGDLGERGGENGVPGGAGSHPATPATEAGFNATGIASAAAPIAASFRNLRELLDAVSKLKRAGRELQWTSHGYKHVAQKNLSWKQVIESTKNGGSARYLPGTNIEALERAVWELGTPVSSGKSWKVMEFAEEIGASGGKSSRWVRVELSGGTIHGHPITEATFREYTR
ncbi:MAG: SpvB/TcaC N-terminal domain-containing protein [Myxococcales bacterium]